jgi:type IV secretion system protein VirB10
LDGEVNNHYLQRFGAAILLTLTDQALQILQTEASKNGQTCLNLNSGGGGGGGGVSSLAQTILQSQINIPPTFSKHQGETMALFLDQPIDFSSSYHLRTVGFKQ